MRNTEYVYLPLMYAALIIAGEKRGSPSLSAFVHLYG